MTADPTSLLSAMAARLGGAFISQIPTIYERMKTSGTCYDLMKQVAKIVSITFDYYI
jgi:hypothetical protein